MALINCPECHGMVSDKAEKCPHCGYVIEHHGAPEVPTKKGHKLWYIAAASVIVALSAIAIILVVKYNREIRLQEAETALEQARMDSIAAVEQDRIAEEYRRDSLYVNFTTPDLNVFQVKGFVKSISMGTNSVCAGGNKQNITINFNTSGFVTSAATYLQREGYSQYLNMAIANSGDCVNKLAYGNAFEGSGYTGYFSFGSNNNRLDHVKVYFNEQYGADCAMVDADISFSEFNEKGLPTMINYHHDRIYEGVGLIHSYSSYIGKISYPEFDYYGNWTQMSIGGNLTDKTVDITTKEVYDQKTYWYTVTLPRTITYYTREEIFGKSSTDF